MSSVEERTAKPGDGSPGRRPEILFEAFRHGDQHVHAVVSAQRGQTTRIDVSIHVDHGFRDRRRHTDSIRPRRCQHELHHRPVVCVARAKTTFCSS